MHTDIQGPSLVQGMVVVPGDKSICHRLLLLAALCSDETNIQHWPKNAEDCQRTREAIEALGASTTLTDGRLSVQGVGMTLRAPSGPIYCGESGTTLRLIAGVLAGQPFTSTLEASPSLARRPMRRIADPLRQMGATIDGTERHGELYAPLTIQGKRPLRAIRYELPVASAQVKSAILLAGLFAKGSTTVIESQSTRNHTERCLRFFGVSPHIDGTSITITPAPLKSPGEAVVPADISSAAFFIVAAAAQPGSQLKIIELGLNPTRTGCLRVLRDGMGADIRVEGRGPEGEQFGTVQVTGRQLKAVTVTAEQVPSLIDELPILLVAATQATGTSRFEGIGELRVKETDRIASMLDGLGRLGASIRLDGQDTVVVDGGRPLRGAAVDAAGDHRTAMSLAIAGLFAQGTTTIRGAECVAKSFPGFFQRLREVTGPSTVKTVDSAGARG